MSMAKSVLVGVLVTIVAACGTAGESGGIEIDFDFSVDEVLADLRDCDLLSEAFVTVIRDAATDIDDAVARTGERLPDAELTSRVDEITRTGYFAVAERLGCNAVAQRVETLERLRQLNPDSAAGSDFLDGVIEELETAR